MLNSIHSVKLFKAKIYKKVGKLKQIDTSDFAKKKKKEKKILYLYFCYVSISMFRERTLGLKFLY